MEFYSSEEWLAYQSGHPEDEGELAWLLHTAGIGNKDHVLDLCCGRGDSVEMLLNKGCFVTGVDSSKGAVDMAKRRWERESKAVFYAGDSRQIPLENQSVDAVLCQCSLSLFDGDIPVVLKEVRRVLKQDGILMLSDLYHSGMDQKMWETYLKGGGFVLEVRKDISETLRTYCMEYLWKTGSLFPVCEHGVKPGIKPEELGYFIGVWRCRQWT